MPRLYRIDSGITIGEITREQIEYLEEALVLEHPGDRDYYLDQRTIDLLRSRGAPADLLRLLESALGAHVGVDVAWDEEAATYPTRRGPYR